MTVLHVVRGAMLAAPLVMLAGCSDTPESKFQEAYNQYKGGDYPVHDVRCQKWQPGEKNQLYTCDFKYNYLPWLSKKEEVRAGQLQMINAIGTKDWWIRRNQ